MKDNINQIIEDLIALDPEFAKHKKELKKILLSLLEARPDPVVDADFVRSLRVKLMDQTEKSQVSGKWFQIIDNFMKKTVFSAAAVAVVLIVAIVGLQMYVNRGTSITSFGSDVRITRASDGAFGNLATLTTTGGFGGQGGGGNASLASAPSMGAEDAKAGSITGPSTDRMMIAPYEPVVYKYVYNGEEIKLDSPKLDVLKKQRPDTAGLAASLGSLGMGLVNLDSFPQSKVQSVSFNQDNGYNVYVDLTSGQISISGHYDMAAMSGKLCTPEQCPPPTPVKESDIPADDTLISVANQFLAEHGIATSAYGEPEVSNEYKTYILAALRANPSAEVYWPDQINVVYPLKINDEIVYDEGGNKMGITVGINIRNNRVLSVWNLGTLDYQASSYDAETDVARVMKVVEAGGIYGYVGEGSKTVNIELGTPTMQYVNMWDYQAGTSQQLLVPSLVFPVTKQPDVEGGYYRKAVVVPLVKSFLDRNAGSPVHIMEGSSGAATPASEPAVDTRVK